MLTITNEDNMVMMSRYPDKHFDLAIVDPEFGMGIAKSPRLVLDKGLKSKAWDDNPIDDGYFAELFRVSKNQIIWGGNYYNLPGNKHCIIWDKIQPEALSFGMFDYAWTSFKGANKIFRQSVQIEKDKIHPTQKPIQLYKWILEKYASTGNKILDTHMGSGSIAIACHDYGYDLTACESDPDYYNAAMQRIKQHTDQLKIF